MTYDEIEAALRVICKEMREQAVAETQGDVEAQGYARLMWHWEEEIGELADQLNLTAHPVTIVRPRKKQ